MKIDLEELFLSILRVCNVGLLEVVHKKYSNTKR